jgi:predicted DNA-binding transcriptional regulator AlpA
MMPSLELPPLEAAHVQQPHPDSRLLVTARTACILCGKSIRTWRTWDSAGLIPRPVRIGRSTLWRVDELKSWIAAGCPRRAEWEARQ